LNVVKGREQRLAQFLRRIEVPIVGGLLSHVSPDLLYAVELGRIGRQQENFQALAICFEPFVDFGLLVIRGVVLNQVHAVIAPVETGQEYLVQETDVCLGIEILGLVSVGELAGVRLDACEDLLGVALAESRHLWL